MPTEIAPEVIAAYRAADYRIITGTAAFSIRVGAHSPPLDELHLRYKVESSAVITACNPYGELRPQDENDAATEKLERSVAAQGLSFLLAVGEDPLGLWPEERSVLVLGIALVTAVELGNQARQNAIVWTGVDARPQLILLR